MEPIQPHRPASDSHNRRIATGFLWVSFFVLVGKFAGAAKEMAIAWRYGVSETVDAYVFVFSLINWPVGIWFSILTVVLLPLVARLRSGNPSEMPGFRGELLGLTLLAAAVLWVVAFLGMPHLLRSGWTGLSGATLQKSLDMAAPLSLLLPLGLVVSLFSAWTMACGRHRNTLLEGLPPLVILVALMLPPGWIPEPLVWGSVAGFALHMAGLGLPLQRAGELQRPVLGFDSIAWQGFWGGVGIMAIGQALMSLTGIIDQFFAARLGAGAISTLNYANRIMALVLSLGAIAISRATLPVFSEMVAKGDGPAVRALAMRWAWHMLLLGLAIMLVVWMLAPWIVALLFERGAFTEANTAEVAGVLRYFLVQTPFYFYALVLVTAFSSQRRYTALLVTGILGLMIKPLANVLLIPSFGVSGLALGMTAMFLATSTYLTIWLKRA